MQHTDDDLELADIMRGMDQPVYRVNQLYGKPFGASKTHEEIAAGRLKTHTDGHSRLVFALDYARWLLSIRREAAQKDQPGARIQKARERGIRSWESRRPAKAGADAA